MKTAKEDAHTHHPGHQVFLGPNPMSYLCSATSKTLKDNFNSILFQGEWKLSKKVHIPTILGTNDSGSRADVIFVLYELRNP